MTSLEDASLTDWKDDKRWKLEHQLKKCAKTAKSSDAKAK